MQMRTFKLAVAIAAVLGLGQAAKAQYGPMGGPAAPYPSVMAPTYMPGPSPYAPAAFDAAAYAGMGGPAMGGPMPGAMMGPEMGGMAGMPVGPVGSEMYCDPEACGWTNHYFAFGEFLYIRPGNAEVSYAVPINGAAAGAGTIVQAGAVRVADPDYASAFRVGFGGVISPRSALMVSYMQFDKDTFDTVSLPNTGSVIRSLVSSPNPLVAAGDGLDAAALHQTQIHVLDVDYKGLAYYTPEWQLAYVVGTRYTNLEQHFAAGFAPASGFEEVRAESEFDGGGLKLGLDAMRLHPTSQFFFYGKGATSFVAGKFRASYVNDLGPNATDTVASFNVGRLVTILDLEAGLGWQSFTGNLRLSMGYLVSGWYNTVQVNDFINSVQTNNFADPADNMHSLFTYDGLTAKVELLW